VYRGRDIDVHACARGRKRHREIVGDGREGGSLQQRLRFGETGRALPSGCAEHYVDPDGIERKDD
jgi:hypothetical protein